MHKILIMALLAGGIASSGQCFPVKGPVKTLEVPAYEVRGTKYLPLVLVCDAYGIDWKWDSVSMVVELNKANAAVRMRVGEYRVYTNGAITVQERPVIMHKGAVYVPANFLKTIFNKFFITDAADIPEAQTLTRKAVPAKTPQPYHRIKKIVLDAGHGGYDPGAIGRDGIKEKYITLDIAKKIAEVIERQGLEVIMTRSDDRFVPLPKRVEIANRSGADLYVSIHANASRTKRLKGFEVYYLSEDIDDNARAAAIASDYVADLENSFVYRHTRALNEILWDLELTENRRSAIDLGNSILDNIDVAKKALRFARFFVLKGARMPAVLVEVGYISNRDDCLRLGWGEYRGEIANKIAKGILDYKTRFGNSGGFTD